MAGRGTSAQPVTPVADQAYKNGVACFYRKAGYCFFLLNKMLPFVQRTCHKRSSEKNFPLNRRYT
ncbi:hypothetical protein CA264_10600 [Pontibacter actiniarum]|uniref:Uncharacterized protein n=1 Tax=Pontibacter actiniarum TaxID=323450 RepID=A0A1X9YSL2_9BACT|nr:hypothetical protein CA264_10600 [Pontibacter actiniarum]